MKNCRAVAMAVVLFMTVALSGCGGSDGPILTMPPGSQVPPGQKPAQMTVDVYWDATVSMKGFTTLAVGNVYRTLPDMLGELGGSLGKARFFRFGKQVTPIEGRNYLRFRDQDCYTEEITSFGNVLDEADPNHLSVVITDLFEDKADWSNVTQKLREKYFSQHLAVAIIGIKNSFYGEIFDVGLNATKFNYNSGDDPVRFRPFYLFLMGSEPQVRTFIERWKEKMPSENIKYVVFSEYFATYVADIQNTTRENLFGDGQLMKADSRLQEVGVADRDKEAKFTLRGKLKKNDYCCLVNKNLVGEHPVKVFAWVDTIVKGESVDNDKAGEKDEENGLLDKISAWFSKDKDAEKDATDDKGESVNNDKAGEKDEENGLLDKISTWFGKDEDAEKDATDNKGENVNSDKASEKGEWQEQDSKGARATFIWSKDTDENGNNCTLELTFQPGITLPWGQIGLIQVQVVPSRENLQLPEWILEWDMGDIDVALEQFDGAKTVNLERIASSLKDSLMATAHPTIAELYLVIDGR